MNRCLVLMAGLSMVACGAAASAPPRSPSDPLEERSAEVLYRTGRELARRHDSVRAEQYLAAAVARGYPEDDAIGPLVAVCLQSTRLRAALSYTAPYLKRHPDAWPLRYLAASIYLALEHPDQARRELEQVLEDAPRHAPSRYLLGVILRDHLGALDEAAAAFRAYLELAPAGPHAREVRAFIEDRERNHATHGGGGPMNGQNEEVIHGAG